MSTPTANCVRGTSHDATTAAVNAPNETPPKRPGTIPALSVIVPRTVETPLTEVAVTLGLSLLPVPVIELMKLLKIGAPKPRPAA